MGLERDVKSGAIVAGSAFLKGMQVLERDAGIVEPDLNRFGQFCAAKEKVIRFRLANAGVRKSAWLRGVNLRVCEDERYERRKNIPHN